MCLFAKIVCGGGGDDDDDNGVSLSSSILWYCLDDDLAA